MKSRMVALKTAAFTHHKNRLKVSGVGEGDNRVLECLNLQAIEVICKLSDATGVEYDDDEDTRNGEQDVVTSERSEPVHAHVQAAHDLQELGSLLFFFHRKHDESSEEEGRSERKPEHNATNIILGATSKVILVIVSLQCAIRKWKQ